jgi:hypothetical protein
MCAPSLLRAPGGSNAPPQQLFLALGGLLLAQLAGASSLIDLSQLLGDRAFAGVLAIDLARAPPVRAPDR